MKKADTATARTIKGTAFCWQSKQALEAIRQAFDATNTVTSALGVYLALTELASNLGAEDFYTTHAELAQLSGLAVRTVQQRVKELADVGLIAVSTPDLRAPSHYTLLSLLVRQPLLNDKQPLQSVLQREVFRPLPTTKEQERKYQRKEKKAPAAVVTPPEPGLLTRRFQEEMRKAEDE